MKALKSLYALNSKYRYSFIPNKDGYFGMNVSVNAYLVDIAPFLFHFNKGEREMYLTKYNHKKEPYTSKIYLNIRFRLSDIEDVKELLCLFGKVPTEVLFMTDYMRCSETRRIEDPSKTHPYLLKSDDLSICKKIEYNKKEFGSEKSKSYYLKLAIGQTGQKTFAYFDVDYAINLEDLHSSDEENYLDLESGLVAGELSYRFHFDTKFGGVTVGTSAKGDDYVNKKRKKEETNTNDEVEIEEILIEENDDISKYDNSYTRFLNKKEEYCQFLGIKPELLNDRKAFNEYIEKNFINYLLVLFSTTCLIKEVSYFG